MLYGDMERVNGQKDYSLVVEDFLATLPSSGIMAAEDAQKIHHICMGHYSAPTELRLRFPMNGEQYSWYRIRHGAVKRDASGRMIQILGILRNIDQSKRESEHLRALSEQDTFTGLLNKHSTNDAISQYLKEYGGEKKHALLMMDLDHFKGINDTYGHQFGDTVLLEFSQVLRRIFHPSDIMGRVGGDEFLVFMKDIPSQAMAEEKAAVLCETFRSQVLFESHPGFQLECSVGLALYPTHGTDFHSLYEKADKALYRAKKNGRFRYEVYQEEASHNPQQNWSHSLSSNSDGGYGCILSRCLELLDQADSMSKALQLVLAEAAAYWKVERVWLAELSPAHSPVRLCSRSSSSLPWKALLADSWWRDGNRFDSSGIFSCPKASDNQGRTWDALRRLCPETQATLQHHFSDRNLEMIIGLDSLRSSRIWSPSESVQLIRLGQLLKYYILSQRKLEEQS